MNKFSKLYLLKAGRNISSFSPRVQQLSGFFLSTKYNARSTEGEAI